MVSALKNVVVVGASFVGSRTATEIASIAPPNYRVLLVEPRSHFNHLFTFPRFSVIPGHEHKSFVPYTKLFSSRVESEPSRHAVVAARVLAVNPDHVLLDTNFEGSTKLPYAYLTIATGTQLAAPSNMPANDKKSGVEYLQSHQQAVAKAQDIVIVGGGAVGVQMATDIKEWFPSKEVTVVQSRARVMPNFHPQLHELVKRRFDELGVRLITGARVNVPSTVPNDGSAFQVSLTTGETLRTDLLIRATGQKPNTQLLTSLPSSSGEAWTNPANGFIRVKPTLQLDDPQYPNIFAVGDVADTGARKTVRAALPQITTVAQNVLRLIEGKEADQTFTPSPLGIHLSLGKTRNVVFRDPAAEGGDPTVIDRDDGVDDMSVVRMWNSMGYEDPSPQQLHL
ncbi:hypothetical protein KEM52_004559 [Ascosphaera acerosa]|nr:hypothetical protein KEM52_004559 [Ascosphaera acerosa]